MDSYEETKFSHIVFRTYHTRKQVAELIFKVIDADGKYLMHDVSEIVWLCGIDGHHREWLCWAR